MMTTTTFAGLAGCAFMWAGLIVMAVKPAAYSPLVRWCVFLFAFGVACVPINGLPMTAYIRTAFGDISITTLVLIAASCLFRLIGRNYIGGSGFFVLMLLLLISGLFLYPFALGLTSFDPYSLGYGSKAFGAVLFCLAVTAWYFRLYLILLCVILAILAYLVGLYESCNLWDYLVDPLIVFYAFFRVLYMAGTSIFSRKEHVQI